MWYLRHFLSCNFLTKLQQVPILFLHTVMWWIWSKALSRTTKIYICYWKRDSQLHYLWWIPLCRLNSNENMACKASFKNRMNWNVVFLDCFHRINLNGFDLPGRPLFAIAFMLQWHHRVHFKIRIISWHTIYLSAIPIKIRRSQMRSAAIWKEEACAAGTPRGTSRLAQNGA